MLASPLLLLLAPLLNIIFHPPTLFWQLTRPALLSAHKQTIHQNVRLDLTQYAIIQISKIYIFRLVRCEKLPNISHKKWMGRGKKVANLQHFSNISYSGIRWPRNTILYFILLYYTLKCPSRGKVHSPLSRFPGRELSSYSCFCTFFNTFNSYKSSAIQTIQISKCSAF